MASYHLRVSMITRSQGRSATAASAYRAAQRIEDRRTGLAFDYAARAGVDHTEIIAPPHAPDWASDRSELWNRVEEAETRKNSRVAREVRVALPDELTHAQRVELVRDFAQLHFVDLGMVADIALHAPGRDGDERNHHAHILLTTRDVDADGFTTKNRDWNKVEVLKGWREGWALDSNAALELAGFDERVDHRTLAEQRDEALERAEWARMGGDEATELHETVRAMSLDRPPLPQLSPGAWQLKKRGIEVAAVRIWHEVKAQAVEVQRITAELAAQVREWLGWAPVERVTDRLVPAQSEIALAGGRDDREQAPDPVQRLRDAWQAHQSREKPQTDDAPVQEAPQDLAARLRQAATGIDQTAFTDRAEALRDGREADERHTGAIAPEYAGVALQMACALTDRIPADSKVHQLPLQADIARMLKKADTRSDLPQEKVNTIARGIAEDRAAFESKIAFARELVASDQEIRMFADRPDGFYEYMFVAQLRTDSGSDRDGQHPMRLNFEALQERYTDEVDMRVTADLASGLARPTKEEHLVARLSLLPDRSEDEASIAAALNEALRWGRPMEGAKLQRERAGVLQGLGSAGDIDRSDARDLLARLYCSHTYREIRALADPKRGLPATMLPIDDAARGAAALGYANSAQVANDILSDFLWRPHMRQHGLAIESPSMSDGLGMWM